MNLLGAASAVLGIAAWTRFALTDFRQRAIYLVDALLFAASDALYIFSAKYAVYWAGVVVLLLLAAALFLIRLRNEIIIGDGDIYLLMLMAASPVTLITNDVVIYELFEAALSAITLCLIIRLAASARKGVKEQLPLAAYWAPPMVVLYAALLTLFI